MKTPAQLAAFRKRCRLGLSRAVTPETPIFRDIRRWRMMADYREAGQPEPDEPEYMPAILLDEFTGRPIGEPVELRALLKQNEQMRAQLAYLTNKVMEKRLEKKKGDGSRYENYDS